MNPGPPTISRVGDALSELFSLSGNTAVVTGGSRGIGKTIARGLLDEGASVGIGARKAHELDAAVEEPGADGPVSSVAADLTILAGVDRLAAEVSDRLPALGILGNNAGAMWGSRSRVEESAEPARSGPTSRRCSL